MDPRQRFSATAVDYDQHRPDYPDALLRFLLGEAPGRRAVELGSGTGILSRQLAAAGFAVTGVEPNATMREAAARHGGSPVYRAGFDAALTEAFDRYAAEGRVPLRYETVLRAWRRS